VSGRQAAMVLAFWGLLNIVLSSLMFLFTSDLVSHVNYWLANILVLVVAAIALRAHDRQRRVLPEASAAAFAFAVAITFLALGAGIGSWAVFVGGAILVVAVVVLALERWA
jgi:uncharacterized membrane protein SirB2